MYNDSKPNIKSINEFKNDDNIRYNIPSYQRLFAWKQVQIETLIDDIQNSGNDGYFLGTIIVNETEKHFDIIDGQQRLTALWLIAAVLKINNFIKVNNNELRVSAGYRKPENEALQALTSIDFDEWYKKYNNCSEVNQNLINAAKIINDKICKVNTDGKFLELFQKVQFIQVALFQSMDSIKYYITMNMRKKQLEPHDILKAKLLAVFQNDDKKLDLYGRLWNSIAIMDSDIENVLDNDVYLKIKDGFQIPNIESLNTKKEAENNSNINDIIANHTIKSTKEGSSAHHTPIINFQSFLRYVYKLTKPDSTVSLNPYATDLLKIYDCEAGKCQTSEEEVVAYFNNLLKYRKLLDQYLVKGKSKGNKVSWEIDKDNENEDAINELSFTQSFLRVARQPEHWVPAALKYLNDNINEKLINLIDFKDWLEKLDDNMPIGDKITEYINYVLTNVNHLEAKNNDIQKEQVLTKLENNDGFDLGTQTPRYYFFKLDYILYKKYLANDGEREKIKATYKYIIGQKDIISKFHFSGTNSIEHVYPQDPQQPSEAWKDKNINIFGNLALISDSSNSYFSNHDFIEKKKRFCEALKDGKIESLKLLEIYKNDNWTPCTAKGHQTEMIELMRVYYDDPHCFDKKE